MPALPTVEAAPRARCPCWDRHRPFASCPHGCHTPEGVAWEAASFYARSDALEAARVPDESVPEYARLAWTDLPADLRRRLGEVA